MWKTKFLTIIFVLCLVFQISGLFAINKTLAGQLYLPKADLIKGSSPEIYILENGVRHWIPNPEIFEYFRYKWTNIKTFPNAVIAAYPQGNNLGKYGNYPDGSLLRGIGPEVYLIELGKRRWIPSPEIFRASDFGWKYIIDIDDKKLDRIKRGDNLTLAEANRYPETIIFEGPEQGEVLETAEVKFKYSGTNPLGPAKDLSFETFLSGYDKRWQRHSYSGYIKTYKLSEQSKVYTFYVRAKNKEGYTDPSPASRSFQIGVSPYYQKVEISKIRAKEDNFENDYLVLRNKDKQIINISGWTIKTKRETVTIPQAIEKLKHPFFNCDDSALKLAYRDEVIISTGLSPRGKNFRTNKCVGYLDQSSRFHPRLSKDCPYLDKSEYSHLKKTCRDFIKKLGRCELADYSENREVNSDSQCTNFLNKKFNYKQCYEDYYQEPDFFGDEWRIFLGKSMDILDNDGDVVVLRDKDGLVVDEFEY